MSPTTDLIAMLKSLAPAARNLRADSRRVEPGDIFLAYPGAAHDGRDHIASAIHAGAAAIAWEPEGYGWNAEWRLPHLPIANLKARAPGLAAAYTCAAASGSHQMLNSAAGVMLPSAMAPPISTTRAMPAVPCAAR